MSAPNPLRLLGLSGSLRKESFSTAILKTLAEAISSHATLDCADIGSLPLYNQDLDGDQSPSSVVSMRQALSESKGLVIVSPEYNHGVPGVLKNAIDWLSRPAFKSSLKDKPTLIITSSPAFTGGVRSQAQLRESLISASARPLMVGEVVIATVHTKIVDGKLTDKSSLDFAMKALTELVHEIQGTSASKAA